MDLHLSELPPLERYKLLIGLVIPRPIAWISTRSENGAQFATPFALRVEIQAIGRGITSPMSSL